MLSDFIDFINQFIDLINDIPAKADSYWERIILWVIILWIELKIASIDFAWSLASGFLASVGISNHIQSAWSLLPSQAAAFLSYLRVPEAINLIITSYITRFILGLLP
jgi:hypothetical protein